MARWLRWVAFEWTLISIAVAIALCWPLLWPIAVVFIGLRQHALAVLGHEAVHFAVHADRQMNRRLNDGLGNALCMWPLLSDVAGFRRFHLMHHQFVGTSLDPEFDQRARFADRWTNLTPKRRAVLMAKDLLGLHWQEPVRLLLATAGRWTWTRGAYVVGLFGLVGFGLGWHVLVAWLVAMATAAFAAMRLRMHREHLGPEVTQVYVAKWWERALYLPHWIWMHERHHRHGCWAVPCWELRRLPR
jgi:hypothetical protein